MAIRHHSFAHAFSVLGAFSLGATLLAGACSSDSDAPAAAVVAKVPGDDSVDGTGPALLYNDCDVLSDRCGFPFPSNVYLVDDPEKKNPSGKTVRFGARTLPRFRGKEPLDPKIFADSDGFSPGQGPMTHMLGATATGMVTQDNLDASLKPDSPTILLDADSGALVPHFVDIDMSPKDETERAIILRPVVRLKDKTRYIVAMRKVVDKDGKELATTPAFAALRDGTPGNHKSVDLRRELYKDIFAKLEAAGVKKDGMQIAWDYTTASRENNTRWLLKMRDEALANYGSATKPFKYRLVESTAKNPNPEEKPNIHTLKRVSLKVTLPLYLNQAAPFDSAQPDKVPRLNFGPDGLPVQNGEFEFDVLVHIPNAIETPGVTLGLLQNGHGLLGSRDEGQNGYLVEMGNNYKWLTFAVDLMGFAEADVPMVTASLGGSPELFHGFIDRQVQGTVNQLLIMRFMMTTFLNDPLVMRNGKTVIDPTVRAYRGDSQGGIMGTTYMAVSTDVTRGLLGEPGMPYNLLLNRSKDWPGYGVILNGAYPNGLDVALLLGTFQMQWDRSEPNGYAPYINENMLPGTPAHQILIHDGLGDHQVTPLGAHIIARTVKAKALKPAVRPIWGIEETDAIAKDAGSGIVEYQFGLPEAPKTNTPASEGSDPHDKVRELLPSYQQSDKFFRTGELTSFCKGICSCYDAEPEANCERFTKQ